MLQALPAEIQYLTQLAFEQFVIDPSHRSLRHHELRSTRRANHREGSCSVSITRFYRAIYIKDGQTNVWYWVGSHADYNAFTGNL